MTMVSCKVNVTTKEEEEEVAPATQTAPTSNSSDKKEVPRTPPAKIPAAIPPVKIPVAQSEHKIPLNHSPNGLIAFRGLLAHMEIYDTSEDATKAPCKSYAYWWPALE